MCRYDLDAIAGFDVPETDGIAEGTRGDHVRLRAESAAAYVVVVTLEGSDAGAGGEVPNAERAVIGSRAKKVAIGGERQVGDAAIVARELSAESEVQRGVDTDGFVGRSGGHE